MLFPDRVFQTVHHHPFLPINLPNLKSRSLPLHQHGFSNLAIHIPCLCQCLTHIILFSLWLPQPIEFLCGAGHTVDCAGLRFSKGYVKKSVHLVSNKPLYLAEADFATAVS